MLAFLSVCNLVLPYSKCDMQAKDKIPARKMRKLLKKQKSSKGRGDDSIFCSYIKEHELNDALFSLDPSKSPGPDKIFGHMLINMGKLARDRLLAIFNLSWRQSKLPNLWKKATVSPILKPGKSADEAKSYRPIPVTCIPCKVMERIIHSRLSYYLVKHGLMP